MKNNEVLRDVFKVKRWLWVLTPLIVAFLVGQAAMYSRSITLKEIRDQDVAVTAELVEVALSKKTEHFLPLGFQFYTDEKIFPSWTVAGLPDSVAP